MLGLCSEHDRLNENTSRIFWLSGLTYDFNLLVSHEWAHHYAARQEIRSLLAEFGDTAPEISRTSARGLTGVRTILDSRRVISLVAAKYATDLIAINYTLKWIPIDVWCDSSNIESIRQALIALAGNILPEEKWMMHLEKRRYSMFHKADLIIGLADVFKQKVDLTNPDKVVWIELIGREAGIAIIRPSEIFSLYRAAQVA